MSGIVNGYVFPPPLLVPPSFETGSQLIYPRTQYGQDYLSPGLPNYDEHLLQKPNLNAQGQSWSHCPEPRFPLKMFRPQFSPRIHVYDHRHRFTRGEETVTRGKTGRGSGRSFKQTNNPRSDHYKRNRWSSLNTMVNHFMIAFMLCLRDRLMGQPYKCKCLAKAVHQEEMVV